MNREAFFHGPRPATDKFPNAVRVGNLVFTSGHVAIDENFDVVAPGDCEAQAKLVFSRISELLHKAGAGMGDVVKINAYLVNRDDYAAYNKARHRWFPDNSPASATVIVADLVKPGLVVEVEAVAVVPE